MKKNLIFFIFTWKKFVFYSMFFIFATFVWPPRWKSWKVKMTAYPILTFVQSFVKFQTMDLEIQMKDDGLQHIFIYATFVWPPRWKSWKRKMTAYPILIFMQNYIQFQVTVPEIQVKRAKRDIHTYIHTYILTYILTNQVIESAISWLKINYTFHVMWCVDAPTLWVPPVSIWANSWRHPVVPGDAFWS